MLIKLFLFHAQNSRYILPFLAVDRLTAHEAPAGCGGVACSDRDGGGDGEQDGAAGNTRAWHTCMFRDPCARTS